jgi:hypothetical protein
LAFKKAIHNQNYLAIMFGAEFVAMKQGMKALHGLRYKLQMMRVQLSGPSYIYGEIFCDT